MNKNINKIKNIINALCVHSDIDSVRVLEELGTNSNDNDIRELTAKALIRKNIHESLSVAISKVGKGINDLSCDVAMSTINEMLALKDKSLSMEVLNDTVMNSTDEEVRENARSVRALMSLC